MTIRIKNLRCRTIIGVHDWEREREQLVIVNVELEFDGTRAAESDRIADTVDYKAIKTAILDEVEKSSFLLLEKLASYILGIVMRDERVTAVTVEVDKPHALRFADSVSVSVSGRR